MRLLLTQEGLGSKQQLPTSETETEPARLRSDSDSGDNLLGSLALQSTDSQNYDLDSFYIRGVYLVEIRTCNNNYLSGKCIRYRTRLYTAQTHYSMTKYVRWIP
jgi:hypothetical protein